MMNPNWYRWIAASINEHFRVATLPLPIFIEGQHRDEPEPKDFFELRVVEQNAVEQTSGQWILRCTINCLVQSTMDDKNNYRIYDSCGVIGVAYTDIPVYKYGCGPADDDTFLGCLQLKQDLARKDLVEVTHFGQVNIDIKLVQSMLEGCYKIELTN